MSAAEILIIDFGGSEREILLTEIEARGLTAESHGPSLTATGPSSSVASRPSRA